MKQITEENVSSILASHSDDAYEAIGSEDKFERLIQKLERKLELIPKIGEYLSDIICLVSLVRSYIKKEYKDVPLGVVISIVSALIYIVSPIDLVPDAIPVIGFVDDLTVLAIVLKLIHSDVEDYKLWRVVNGKEVVNEL